MTSASGGKARTIDDGRQELRFERHLGHPIESVWAAHRRRKSRCRTRRCGSRWSGAVGPGLFSEANCVGSDPASGGSDIECPLIPAQRRCIILPHLIVTAGVTP